MPVTTAAFRQAIGDFHKQQRSAPACQRAPQRTEPAAARQETQPPEIAAAGRAIIAAGNRPLDFARHLPAAARLTPVNQALLILLLLSQIRSTVAPASSPAVSPPAFIGREGNMQIIIYDKDGEIVNLSPNSYEVVNKPPQQSFIRQGQQALKSYFDSYNSRYPDLLNLASSLLKQQLAQRFGLNIDPDRSWFMHFAGGDSNQQAITGWEHNEAPVEYGTLTSYLFHNFPAEAQDNLNGLNAQCGIYRQSPQETNRFDNHNQVPLRPADFVQLVWDIDFFNQASEQVKQAFSDKAAHIKKAFIDFCLGLGISQLDATSQKDVLSAIGFGIKRNLKISALDINGYQAATAFIFANKRTGNRVLYLPNSKFKFSAFRSDFDMRAWLVNNCAAAKSRAMLASHFTLADRQDGMIFSGVDGWLEKLNNNHDLSDNIATQRSVIRPASFFSQLVDNLQRKALADLNVLVTSDSTVRRNMWENYVDAASLLPNPVTPFLSLALHLEHVIDSSSYAEKLQEWHKTENDVTNLLLLLLLDKTIKFNDEGYRFINKVREGFATLDAGGEAPPEAGNPLLAGVQDTLSGLRGRPLVEQLVKRIDPALYIQGMDASQLTPPGSDGLRFDSLGNSYLRARSGYLRIRKLNLNRYRIANTQGQREFILRLKNGRYYEETLSERLANIKAVGMNGGGGRQAALALLETLESYRQPRASELLDNYQFPEDGILNSYTFAEDTVRYGQIPEWAAGYHKASVAASSDLYSVVTVHTPNSSLTRQLCLGEQIGRGVFGDVYLDASDNRYVIKRFRPALFGPEGGERANSAGEIMTKAHEEVKTFKHCYGDSEAEIYIDSRRVNYIRMRKIEGASLASLAKRTLPSDAVERYVDMLEQLARRGIMHDDLHPRNIIWSHGRFLPVDMGNDYAAFFSAPAKGFYNLSGEQRWKLIIRTIEDKIASTN